MSETIEIKTKIPLYRVADLLCTALEGGSNYWMGEIEINRGEETVNPWGSDEYCPNYMAAPFEKNGNLTIREVDGSWDDKPIMKRVLNLESIQTGLQIMSNKYPSHMGEFLQDNEDAATGDVFLQCCLFDEVKYG